MTSNAVSSSQHRDGVPNSAGLYRSRLDRPVTHRAHQIDLEQPATPRAAAHLPSDPSHAPATQNRKAGTASEITRTVTPSTGPSAELIQPSQAGLGR